MSSLNLTHNDREESGQYSTTDLIDPFSVLTRKSLISKSAKLCSFLFLIGLEFFLVSQQISGLPLALPVVLLLLLFVADYNYEENIPEDPLNKLDTRNPKINVTKSKEQMEQIQKNSRTNTIISHYQLDEEIGMGATGTIYLAHDLESGEKVAIKTLPLSKEFDPSEIEAVKQRFFREAETAGQLSHQNIVKIYFAGEERGLAYIVMELLSGHDLTRYTKKDNLLSPMMAMGIVHKAARAMHYAHSRQIIHRDLKPANIMFDPEQRQIKLTDFGIARLIDASRTRAGIILGSPAYMSPEQLEGSNIDARSDLFALGVMLFQLLTGELPFQGESLAMLIYLISHEPHHEIFKLKPELAEAYPGISDIIDKALEKDPEDRYQNGYDLAEALKICAKQ